MIWNKQRKHAIWRCKQENTPENFRKFKEILYT